MHWEEKTENSLVQKVAQQEEKENVKPSHQTVPQFSSQVTLDENVILEVSQEHETTKVLNTFGSQVDKTNNSFENLGAEARTSKLSNERPSRVSNILRELNQEVTKEEEDLQAEIKRAHQAIFDEHFNSVKEPSKRLYNLFVYKSILAPLLA